MPSLLSSIPWKDFAIWFISLLSIALVLIRPRGWPEAIWSCLGAAILVISRLVPVGKAGEAIGKGMDVYLFLTGMMIMSELARREGVFDWVAAKAVNAARGSRIRLFGLIYTVGIVVTVFLSNDATAVVLTPAVQAAVKAANAEPLPYLMICAFIANAASFVLPISNPANLVVYREEMPPLGQWLVMFGLASVVSIIVTFLCLRLLSRKLLRGEMETHVERKPLSSSGKITLGGVFVLAVVLLVASGLGTDLGAPACLAAFAVALPIVLRDRKALPDVAREISWSVLLLVAGLFVIVEGINEAGALHAASSAFRELKNLSPASGVLSAAFSVALLSNLMNNLPSGLISGAAVAAAKLTGPLRSAVLVGIDLGPNLSVTGSLATILWLIAIRREGQKVGFWKFLGWGIVAMPPALGLSVLVLLLHRG